MHPDIDEQAVLETDADEWEDMPPPGDDVDDFADLYLLTGGVWPEGIPLDVIAHLGAGMMVGGDYFDDFAADLEK